MPLCLPVVHFLIVRESFEDLLLNLNAVSNAGEARQVQREVEQRMLHSTHRSDDLEEKHDALLARVVPRTVHPRVIEYEWRVPPLYPDPRIRLVSQAQP